MARQKNIFEETNNSETITENIFRNFYGTNTFIEKSAIPKSYGFTSKKGTDYNGYPDFFIDISFLRRASKTKKMLFLMHLN